MSELKPEDQWPSKTLELELLMRELRFVNYQLRSAITRSGAISSRSGTCSLLSELAQQGPRSIPMLMENRAVSRQYLQKMVDQLHKEGIVEFIENPKHKRSKLVALTARGEQDLNHRRQVYLGLLTDLDIDSSEIKIGQATETLQALRQSLKKLQH